MSSFGATRIETKCGDKFDVNLHEAIATQSIIDSAYKSDEIVQIFQSGWLLDNKLLRPTKVVVGK